MLALAPAAADTPLAVTGSDVAFWDNTRGRQVALASWRPGDPRPKLYARVKPGPIGRWDLDVGRGPRGALWATYTHCLPGGCRPWAIDLDHGVQRDLGVGRGRAPAVWGDMVVFTRAGHLYRGRVGRPSSVRRLPVAPHERVESIELRGDRLAYTTRDDDEGRNQTLWSGRLSDAAHVRAVDRGFEGEECSREIDGVTLSASGLSWTRFLAGSTACQGRTSALVRRPGATTKLPVGTRTAVLVGGRTLSLSVPAARADREDRQPCVHGHTKGCAIRVD